MGTQNYVTNRSKVQFANVLPFGKIVSQGTTSVTAAANSSGNVSISHSIGTTPNIIAWGQVSGDTKWIPLYTTDQVTNDEYGYRLYLRPYTTSTTLGVDLLNKDAGAAHTVSIKYWLYVI